MYKLKLKIMPAHFELFNTFITKYVEFTEDELIEFQ